GSAGTQLAMELRDKTGKVKHANRPYQITGPETFEGVTDSQGRLDHRDVLPGDYTLKLTLEFFEGKSKVVDEYTCNVVVTPSNTESQLRLLGAVPRCEMARLRGMLFETDKCFLLPSAISELRDKIRPLYERSSPGKLLVVGHTDTTGSPSTNDPLSLDRARATVAYLEDRVEDWLAFYDRSVPENFRWGAVEDTHMLGEVLTPEEKLSSRGDFIGFFRRSRELEETATMDEPTRRRLVAEYMGLDGVTLDPEVLDIEATAHGCGENFPVDETGAELDEAPQNDADDALDRRVELFFFDTEFGIQPPPPGETSRRGST